MYSIGEIISTYRKKKGLLQQDLADELAKEGITISYKAISNWERNLAEPSVTIFYKVCRILGITNMYEAYFGVNPADPFSSLTDEGREKAMDYINLLHASGMYEKQTATCCGNNLSISKISLNKSIFFKYFLTFCQIT